MQAALPPEQPAARVALPHAPSLPVCKCQPALSPDQELEQAAASMLVIEVCVAEAA